jgi:glucokinase
VRALTVDLGGSHATCALVEEKRIVASRTISADRTSTLYSLLPSLAENLKEIRGEMCNSSVASVVFSFCGLVDYARSRILSTNAKFDDGPNLDLVAWCREELDLPLRMENDARLALLGEWYAGAAEGCDDVVMITLGTGIGGAAMSQGRLLRGKHSQAGCLGGHLPVDFEGRACSCGAVGCAEAEASSVSLPDVCHSHPQFSSSSLAAESLITFETLFNHVRQGDCVAREVADRCLRVWGANIVGLIHAYDPELVLVGGGVMKSASHILPFLQDYVQKHAWTPWGKVRVAGAKLGSDAALLGAVPLLKGVADP